VEIGGSFRVPDVMAKSQAVLREVGTTNRTRISDYEQAITAKTRLLLRVHRSNFAIVGFTEQPTLQELVALGKKHKLPVIEDQGNGSLVDLQRLGVSGENGVVDSLRAGVDLVTYSGDKLLGGPQAGMLSGHQDAISKVRNNPLFRALRVDKLTYAALEATLLEYLAGRHDSIPTLRMLREPAHSVRSRAEKIASEVSEPGLHIDIKASESLIGGGTAPSATLPTFVLTVSHRSASANDLARKLRQNVPPIVGRVEDDLLRLDLRTVAPEDDVVVAAALKAL
jgi:L-seryl-tRNA(Ser) seleniumtransferase